MFGIYIHEDDDARRDDVETDFELEDDEEEDVDEAEDNADDDVEELEDESVKSASGLTESFSAVLIFLARFALVGTSRKFLDIVSMRTPAPARATGPFLGVLTEAAAAASDTANSRSFDDVEPEADVDEVGSVVRARFLLGTANEGAQMVI